MIQSYKRKGKITAVVFVAAFACGLALLLTTNSNFWEQVFVLLYLTCTGAYFLAFWWFIKAKGREGLWMLWSLFPLIGLPILLCLEDHAEDGRPPSTPPY